MKAQVYNELLSLIYFLIPLEGGDGDAIWLVKSASLDEVKKIIEEYNAANNTEWEIKEYENHINWGIDQQWATITCDETFFNLQKEYNTLQIIY